MTNRCQGVRDDSMTAGMSHAEKTLVPLVDLKAQSLALQPRIQARISETLSACRFILGPEVEELENELAKFSGARHAICVASGTDALKISLMTEGLGPGDAVLVPSFTFVGFRSDFGHNDRAECSAEGKRDGITAGILMSSVGVRMPRSD